MEHVTWTTTQKQRLRELNAPLEVQSKTFQDTSERDNRFHAIEKDLIKKNKERLRTIYTDTRRPKVCTFESILIGKLIENGFTQVVTPILISKSSLLKMSIVQEHELYKKVFWINDKQCLRPMLAPNLYVILRRLFRVWKKPVKIFEIGPCFRKDSSGKFHLKEFTMLNLVELGLSVEIRMDRLKELTSLVMATVNIKNYTLTDNPCNVYGSTIDVVAKGLEVASGVLGPHPLDAKWGITEPWVGIGFGIERLALAGGSYLNIQQVGRSLTYLDGIRLNI